MTEHQDNQRLRTMKQCLLLCSVAQCFHSGFTVQELVDRFQQKVGYIHYRTAMRYANNLEMCGLIEEVEGKPNKRGKASRRFKWAGWPEPLH
ncbi:hypothetical protein [Blastopirellula retiformator]|uniref:Ferric uptake regulator family protein n=1 Tax=Blastopirellula retiformator TaxID=2527970 RepID=A0A5C5UWE8_9BACT|nr:hypothetical protein [Blastopirellula retiformator]TWT30686.1 hypothetical protein Enr8_42090 [Blastopirellula retiformator]